MGGTATAIGVVAAVIAAVPKHVGAVALVAAVIVMVLNPRARPTASELMIPVGAAAVVGLMTGLVLRRRMTLNRRLEFMHRLSPRLAKRLLPANDVRRRGSRE